MTIQDKITDRRLWKTIPTDKRLLKTIPGDKRLLKTIPSDQRRLKPISLKKNIRDHFTKKDY
jgi:hypothetical protein